MFPNKSLQDNENNLTSEPNLHVRFESAANQLEIPPDQYRQYMRGLNEQQRSIVVFWCTKAVQALKEGKPVEPYHVFLSGVDRSHVIKVLHSDTLKLLKLSGAFEPDDVNALQTVLIGGGSASMG